MSTFNAFNTFTLLAILCGAGVGLSLGMAVIEYCTASARRLFAWTGAAIVLAVLSVYLGMLGLR